MVDSTEVKGEKIKNRNKANQKGKKKEKKKEKAEGKKKERFLFPSLVISLSSSILRDRIRIAIDDRVA